jgi:hypothetical protein
MLVETRHLAVVGEPQRIPLGGPGWRDPGNEEGWRFLPSVAGGAFELPADDGGRSDRLLLWQLTTHRASVLQLVEVSAAHGQIGAAVALELDGHAFAGAAFGPDPDGGLALCLLFSEKTAARLRLSRPATSVGSGRGGSGASAPAAASGAPPGPNQPQRSLLDGLQPGSLQLLPLTTQLGCLGAPAALSLVAGHLVVGGASDNVTCVPLRAFDARDPTAVQQLLISTSLLQRLVGSLYQPVTRAGVVSALPAADAAGRPLLALVTDGAQLRVWAAPPAAALLASHELLPGAAARQLVPRAAVAAGGAPPGELLVVAQLEAPDAPGQATLAACHIRLGDASDGSGGGGAASEALARFALQLPVVGARLLGAQLRGGALHVLAAVPGGETRLMAFSARDGAYLGAAQLLSKGPSPEWAVAQVGAGQGCGGTTPRAAQTAAGKQTAPPLQSYSLDLAAAAEAQAPLRAVASRRPAQRPPAAPPSCCARTCGRPPWRHSPPPPARRTQCWASCWCLVSSAAPRCARRCCSGAPRWGRTRWTAPRMTS